LSKFVKGCIIFIQNITCFLFFEFGEKCIFVRFSQPFLKNHMSMPSHGFHMCKVCVPHVTKCFCTCEGRTFLQEKKCCCCFSLFSNMVRMCF